MSGNVFTVHKIPAGATITAVEPKVDGMHLEYQAGTKLTHVNIKIADAKNGLIEIDAMECDYKNLTLGIG